MVCTTSTTGSSAYRAAGAFEQEPSRDQDMAVIAMTREIGSHGSDVAAGVAKQLGLKIANSEIIANDIAGSLGVGKNTVQRYIDGSASLFDRWQIDKRKLAQYTCQELLDLALQGDVLIRGWGAAALFSDIPNVLSVRVCAPMAIRERVMMERLGVKHPGTVRQEIENFDTAHTRTMRTAFNVERDDARLYHVVLNTGRVSVDDCVKIVCQLARNPRYQNDSSIKSALAERRRKINAGEHQ